MSEKKSQPGREPWMSDAGYEGWLRTQELAPNMAKMADCKLTLKCPHCGFSSKMSFEAETMPSGGFDNEVVCKTCGKDFVIDAVLDVKVITY